ncbi:MAG TPA: cyclic nucleotide-binding domain-containing protein [Candidatus Limnocylindrales bacterium]|nr:cyclic nucleotide-binding domain-containing protein [Candidatus Limnocylindrales bacterium]
MAGTDSRTQLKKVPLFAELDRKELEMLAHLLKEHRYKAGTPIVKDGAAGHGLYVIKEGAAIVRKNGRTVARLGPGEFFGEIAVLDDGPRTADVVADTDTVCLTLVAWEVRPLLMENASITFKMLMELVRRQRAERPRVVD